MIGVQLFPMECSACGHQWMGEMLCNAAISVFSAHLESLTCPECGAGEKSILLVTGERGKQIEQEAIKKASDQ